MQLIKSQLINLEKDIDTLDITRDKNESECDLKEFYDDRDINLVQIFIALSICIICIGIICILIVTGKLQNIAAISQIRDSMCSSVGFLICESRKNRK